VADDGFSEGLHLSIQGADQFTEHFEREVFVPVLRRFYSDRPAPPFSARRG
jgi:hypothetical protein